MLRVRIPPSPLYSLSCREIGLHYLQESLKIAGIPQVLPSNRTGESVPSNPVPQVLWRFSLEGTRTVRFQRLHQANAMRLQPTVRRKRLDFVSDSDSLAQKLPKALGTFLQVEPQRLRTMRRALPA
jgi:hypothetical protein